jgi:hypothetical protein
MKKNTNSNGNIGLDTKCIPSLLKGIPNWVLGASKEGKNGKREKIPINVKTGDYAKCNDPSTWSTYSEALAALVEQKWDHRHQIQGLSFALSETDNFVCIDVDKEIVDGEMGLVGQSIHDKFPNTYIETSPSGTGFHVWLKGKLPENSRNRNGNVEVYQQDRFMTVTGIPIEDNPIFDCQESLNWLIQNHIGIKNVATVRNSKRSTTNSAGKKGFFNKIAKHPDYSLLFNDGDFSNYPSQSEADLALMAYLARITKGDEEMMISLFDESELGQREKWISRPDYQESLIEKALEGYDDNKPFEINVQFDGERFISNLPSFPIGALHEKFAKLVTEISKSISNLPVEISAVTLLGVVGALIGRMKKIQPKKGWLESANAFYVIVAASGEGKSPAMKAILNPVYKWEEEKQEEYRHEKAEYEICERDDPSIDHPNRKRLLINDTTPEALVKVFSENPRGLLWYSDEIVGLILNLDRYSGGNSKHLLMSCYDGAPIYIDRKVEGTTYIPNPCLSMLGSIQPDVLPEAFSQIDAVNGLLARTTFVFASRERPDFWSEEVVSQESTDFLNRYIQETLDDDKPEIISLKDESKEIFVNWVNQRAEAIHLCSKEEQRSVFNKEKSKALKLILALHHMQCFADNEEFKSDISPQIVMNALTLTDYLNDHQIQVWRFLEKNAPIHLNPFDKRVASVLVKFSPFKEIFPGEVAKQINSQPKTVASAFNRIGMTKGIRIKKGMPYSISEELLNQLKSVCVENAR